MSKVDTSELTSLLPFAAGPATTLPSAGASSDDTSRGDFARELSSASASESREEFADRQADAATEPPPETNATVASEEASAEQNAAEDQRDDGQSDQANEQSDESETDQAADDQIVAGLAVEPAVAVNDAVPIEFTSEASVESLVEQSDSLVEATSTEDGLQQSAELSGEETAVVGLAEFEAEALAENDSVSDEGTGEDAEVAGAEDLAEQVDPPAVGVVGDGAIDSASGDSQTEVEGSEPKVTTVEGATGGETGNSSDQPPTDATPAPAEDTSAAANDVESDEVSADGSGGIEETASAAEEDSTVEATTTVEDGQAEAEVAPADKPTASRPEPNAPNVSLERIAAGRIDAARTDQASSENHAPRVDATRFVNRVSRAFESAQQRGGEVRLRLSPPELGALTVKLSMNEGAMTATVETETATARNVLLDNLPALRERLAQLEIRIEKFDVDVQQHEGRQEQAMPDDKQQRQSGRGTEAQAESQPTSEAATATLPSPARADPSNSGEINLVA